MNMSDTANTGNLASAPTPPAEFDARLKRTDEARWLATRYAPAADRERLTAIYCLNLELQRAIAVSEGMLGKIRVQWWRETLEGLAGKAPVRRHDLTLELARVLRGRTDLLPRLDALIDRADDIIDDHMHGIPDDQVEAHRQNHMAMEAALMCAAGLSLTPDVTPEQLAGLAVCGEAYIAVTADLPDAATRWQAARVAAHALPGPLWPAIAHLAAPRGPEASPLKKRWNILRAVFSRKLQGGPPKAVAH
jgi:phytoene synthase